MNKKDLVKILHHYSKFRPFVLEGNEVAFIMLYGRKHKVEIPKWVKKIEGFIKIIIDCTASKLIREIIVDLYLRGKCDLEIITKIPMSESTYYRTKRSIEETLFQLFILDGDVSLIDILDAKILD